MLRVEFLVHFSFLFWLHCILTGKLSCGKQERTGHSAKKKKEKCYWTISIQANAIWEEHLPNLEKQQTEIIKRNAPIYVTLGITALGELANMLACSFVAAAAKSVRPQGRALWLMQNRVPFTLCHRRPPLVVAVTGKYSHSLRQNCLLLVLSCLYLVCVCGCGCGLLTCSWFPRRHTCWPSAHQASQHLNSLLQQTDFLTLFFLYFFGLTRLPHRLPTHPLSAPLNNQTLLRRDSFDIT